jgi:hypothetical protein
MALMERDEFNRIIEKQKESANMELEKERQNS